MRIATGALCAALILAHGMPAQAAELHILVSGAIKSAIYEIQPLFEKASGHKLIVAAGIPSSGKQPDAARALLAFLASPPALAIMKAKGLD